MSHLPNGGFRVHVALVRCSCPQRGNTRACGHGFVEPRGRFSNKSTRRSSRSQLLVVTLWLVSSSSTGFGGVCVGVTCMPRDVRSGRSMTCGPGGESSGGVSGVTGSGMCGECRDARIGHQQLTACPGASRFDGSARPVVIGIPDLEVREHTPGGLGSPSRQCDVRLLVESLR